MTTIVADLTMGRMAADRRVTTNDGEILATCPCKIERLEIGGDEYLVGLAGLEGPGLIFMEWLEQGEWDEPPDPIYDIEDDDDFTILMLSAGEMWVVDKFMRMVPVHDRWYGIGTGGNLAWAVLMAGCGMHPAMQTAIKMDPSSGDGYDIWYLDGTEEDETDSNSG